jgi:ADP-heptose:LPS heptosyltransferase
MNRSDPKRILLCRTDRLGDTILAVPCAMLVKRLFPDCHLSFMVQPYTASFVRLVEDIDEVIEVSREAGVREISQLGKAGQFDAAVVLYPEYRIARALQLANIPQRAGIAYRWYSALFTYRHREHRKHNIKHEAEYNLALTYAVFKDACRWREYIQPQDLFPLNLHRPDSVKDAVDRHPGPLDTGGRILAVHPGGGGSAHRWPVDRYCEVVSHLARRSEVRFIVSGNHNEADLCGKVSDAAGDWGFNFCGKLSLEELTETLRRCDLLITNSTGPLHLARAVGTNVLGLFPRDHAMSPVRWGPYGLPENVLMPPEGQPMTALTAEAVIQKAAKLLNSTREDE